MNIIKGSKGFSLLVVLLAVVAVGLTLGAGWYVWSQRQDDTVDLNNSQNSEINPIPEESAGTEEPDKFGGVELANHVDSEWGFSFSYPSSLRKSISDGGNFPVSLYNYPESQAEGRGFAEGATDGKSKISFLVARDAVTDDIDTEIKKAFSDDDIASIQKLDYSNVNSALIEYIDSDNKTENRTYYILEDNLAIRISVGGDVTTTDIYKTVEAIISTIKFDA